MGAVFIKLLNMSITANYLVLAIALFRLIFRKAPKSAVIRLGCKNSPDPVGMPTISLDKESNGFQFSWSAFSSYLAMGTYELTDSELILTTEDDFHYVYRFAIEDGESFVFNAKNSSEIPKYQYSADGEAQSPVLDGAVFEKIPLP